MQPKHAKTRTVRVVDTFAAVLTLVIGRKSQPGRHALPSTVTSGASPAYARWLHVLNESPVVGPEVRA